MVLSGIGALIRPSGIPLTAAWRFDSGGVAYVDNTIEAQSQSGTAFPLLSAAGDFFYFGFSRRIDALMWQLAVSGSHGALTWAYGVTSGSWLQFVPLHDGAFVAATEYMRWDIKGSTVDTDWVSFAFDGADPHAAAPPDTTSRFWLRVSAASVTTATTLNNLLCRPFVTYATAVDVQRQLQLSTPFSTTSLPTIETVEGFLRGAEDRMIRQTGKSWRPEFVEDEQVNFKQYGMKLRREDIIHIYELAVWDGSSYDVKTEGRDEDFFVEPLTGIIYVATIFLDAMPPTMRRSYTARREQGAFKRAVKVNYSWGKDIRYDGFGVEVGRITVKQACIDLVTDLDFAPLIPLGLDSIGLQDKVNNWQADVDKFMDTYSKIRLI